MLVPSDATKTSTAAETANNGPGKPNNQPVSLARTVWRWPNSPRSSLSKMIFLIAYDGALYRPPPKPLVSAATLEYIPQGMLNERVARSHNGRYLLGPRDFWLRS